MPRGTVDDSNVLKQALISAVTDVGELAVRLGAISSIDRSGDVFSQTQFGDGWGLWQSDSSGTGAYVRLSSLCSRSQGVCARLRAGNAEDDYAALYVFIRNPLSGKIAVEMHFTYLTAWKKLTLRLAYYTGTTVITFEVVLDLAAGQLSYLNAAGGYTVFGTLAISAREAGEWQAAKMVIDLPNDRYWRFLLNDVSYDMASCSPKVAASTPPSALLIWLQITSGAVTYADFFIDDILVTANEV